MKKLIVVLIIVLLLSPASLAFSTTVLAKEILFRGIPWGSNYYYVESQSISEGVSLGSISGDMVRIFSIDEVLYGLSSRDDTLRHNINLPAYGLGKLPNVAGYEVKGIDYYFAFIDKDGILTRDKADTSLYAGSYEFLLEDPESAYHDITNKLVGLYGAYAETFRKGYKDKITDNIRTWSGDNDTFLMVRWDVSDSRLENKGNFYIHYVWAEGNNLLKHASEIAGQMQLKLEEEMRQSQDKDGL
jgi:hypothetical protein